MTTATDPHARTRDGIFLETPPAIRAACVALIAAAEAHLASEGDYYEQNRLCEAHREAQDEVERVIGDHQGRSYLSGLYRVDGWLVGFRKINKRGLSLVVYPTDETKKGLRS